MDPAIRRQTIADLLHRSAKRYPGKTGLICGGTRWTFTEFDAVVDRVAAGLAGLGVGHASRVAVLAPRVMSIQLIGSTCSQPTPLGAGREIHIRCDDNCDNPPTLETASSTVSLPVMGWRATLSPMVRDSVTM